MVQLLASLNDCEGQVQQSCHQGEKKACQNHSYGKTQMVKNIAKKAKAIIFMPGTNDQAK